MAWALVVARTLAAVGLPPTARLRRFAIGLALVTMVACDRHESVTTPTTDAPGAIAPPIRVLLFSATAGFRHDSIPTSRTSLAALAASTNEFSLAVSEDVADLEAARLAGIDVVFFAMTSGELPLNAAQKASLLAFVAAGHGFIGTHSATDTLYDWPEYRDLIGAQFKEHPWTQTATVSVEDRDHPTSAGLSGSFQIQEEFYTFRQNPRPSVHVLLSLDAASVGAAGDYPLAWTRSVGAGRVYYNALGHFPATWTDQRFLRQMRAAIVWAAGTR